MSLPRLAALAACLTLSTLTFAAPTSSGKLRLDPDVRACTDQSRNHWSGRN